MSVPAGVSVGQRLQVTIERLVFQGSGLGHLPDGRVVFVPYTAPGDLAEVEVAEAREDFIRATLVRVVTPSPVRVAPPCRYYGNCGGCQWQHLEYAAQLHWKREILHELLARVGKLSGVLVAEPAVPAGPWEYRARAQFKIFAGARLQIGFHQRETQRVVDLDRCPLLDARLNDVLRTLRGMRDPALHKLFPRVREVWAAAGTGTGEVVVSLFARAQDRAAIRLLFHRIQAEVPALTGVVLLDGDPRQHPRFVDRHGQGAILERVGDCRFRVDAAAFFQVSGLAAGTLTRLVMEAAALTGTERVLDLYSGVGTFTVPLARLTRQVLGIEANAAAATDAVQNLRSNGCPEARIVQAQVEQVLPALAKDGPWDLVVLDPPRQGCSRQVLDAVTGMGVPRVIYVSCDPSTLARDLGILVPAGYRCLSLQPVDLFPQTFHLESVAVLERTA
ncbi:MAG: 23S rRNA (uracil(1939)-C(5))-methyltransferase RlmD [candidate division NC10 bacterium]|nr:23S rRNA (uracil(1939)-C(5))-methyltransferase RlmD [candidate division NC10 bacterium]